MIWKKSLLQNSLHLKYDDVAGLAEINKYIKVILSDSGNYWNSKYVRKSESHVVFKNMSL